MIYDNICKYSWNLFVIHFKVWSLQNYWPFCIQKKDHVFGSRLMIAIPITSSQTVDPYSW